MKVPHFTPRWLRGLWRAIDNWDPAAEGAEVTCQGVGCNACCKRDVMVTQAEATAILHQLNDDQVAAVMAADAADLGGACPLLAADGGCSVYEHRPTICRAYRVVTPPEWCDDDEVRPMFPGRWTSTTRWIGRASTRRSPFTTCKEPRP